MATYVCPQRRERHLEHHSQRGPGEKRRKVGLLVSLLPDDFERARMGCILRDPKDSRMGTGSSNSAPALSAETPSVMTLHVSIACSGWSRHNHWLLSVTASEFLLLDNLLALQSFTRKIINLLTS